jgi:anti-anti-sigma factor
MALLTSHQHGNCQVLKLCTAKFDASLVPEFVRDLASIATPMPGDLVLDMSDVQFIDSSAIGALLSMKKRHTVSASVCLRRAGLYWDCSSLCASIRCSNSSRLLSRPRLDRP